MFTENLKRENMTKKVKKQVKNMAHKHYELIKETVGSWLKLFGLQRIPLENFNQIIDKLKLDETGIEEGSEGADQLRLFYNRFNETLDVLKKTAKSHSDKIAQDDKISQHEVNQMVQALKDGFTSGLEQQAAEDGDSK